MSKLDINDGKPIYNEKGKVMKGPNYFKPNLNKFVDDEKSNLLLDFIGNCIWNSFVFI